jgi:hypothetical protein
LKLALIVGGIAAVTKLVGAKKAEWHGLTEAEVRAKLDAKLPDRMPADKQGMVADKVVAKMRSRGALVEEGNSAESDDEETVTVGADDQPQPESS